ncbi:RNA-directed DNA polymerase from mobile element jockey, partial [Colius striatus]
TCPVEEVKDFLGKLNTRKSMGPDGMHPRVVRKLADVIAELLSVIFKESWRTGKVPEDWRKANVTPVFKKGRKDDSGNYRPVSLTSIPGKMLEQLILNIVNRHMRKKMII